MLTVCFPSFFFFFPSLSFIYFYILRTIVIISFFSFYAEWLDIESRRRFFEAYANENKFDPLIAENWYMQSYSQFFSENVRPPSLLFSHLSIRLSALSSYFFSCLLSFVLTEVQGARGVLIHHKNSVRTALMELFPNIGIDKSKFHFQRMFLHSTYLCIPLFCFVLFCFVLFCFVLFCFVLFCFVLFCFVLFCFVLFCFVLFCFVY